MTEATQEEVNALAGRVGELVEAVQAQTKESRDISVSLTQTSTMLRNFIGEQRTQNERVNRVLDEHTNKIGDLEKFRVHVEATTPKTLLDGDKIEKKFKDQDDAITRIEKTIAKWGGAIALIVLLAKIGPPIVQWIF